MPVNLVALVVGLEKRLGLRPAVFAGRLGFGVSSVRNWKKGDIRPGLSALESMRRIAASTEAARDLLPQIDQAIREYEWHPKPKHTRISPELRDELVLALDIILENAPLRVIKDVNRILTKRAGDYVQLDATSRAAGSEAKKKKAGQKVAG